MDSLLKDRPTVEAPPATQPPPAGNRAEATPFVGLGAFLAHRDRAKHSPDQPPGRAAEPRCTKPEVEVIEEEGVIVRLIVTCKCGERIEIDCQYR